MHVAVLFGKMCLSFRGDMTFDGIRADPRGLTGSELGCLRISEELSALGHDVTIYTVSTQQEFNGIHIRSIDGSIEACDVAIAINEPDLLRLVPPSARRILWCCLNDFSFARVGFENHVDLFLSPSAPHLEQFMTNLEWRKVEKTPQFPDGKAMFTPDASKWVVLPLGCDPERFGERNATLVQMTDEMRRRGDDDVPEVPVEPAAKIPARVVHCSSPDRGLHHLLGAWPAIKAAVPEATLHIFYRLGPWLRGFDQTPYFPPIEPLRARANYVEECLTRFAERGGMGVTLRDSVSREVIEGEMAQAEVLAYPCDTTTWSEGFSCTVLEACAARACPIISDCDALGEVYAPLDPVPRGPTVGGSPVSVGWVKAWTARVIDALKSPEVRAEQNERAYNLASKLTWKIYAEKLVKEIESRWPQHDKTPQPPSSNQSEPAPASS